MHSKATWHQADVLSLIDYTELRIDASYGDLELACCRALEHGFGAVTVHPIHVARCTRFLSGSQVRVDAVVGFHTGGFTIENKVFEARDAVEKGADEIDYVIHVAALKTGDVDRVRREMEALRKATEGLVIKAVLETCLLSDEEKAIACRCAIEAGVDFVQTSTGCSTGGATIADVSQLASVLCSSGVGVKAAGGIRTASEVRGMIEAGATRVGTSAGVAIAGEMTATDGE